MNVFQGISDWLYGNHRYTIDTYELEIKDQLAEGGYAIVYRAIDMLTGQEFALKMINCPNEERLQLASKEVEVLQRISPHDNIVRYYGSRLIDINGQRNMLILMELCLGGTLVNLLEKYDGKLTVAQIIFVMKELCMGTLAVHNAGYVHLDLKVENVLLNNKRFKLCDFGSCMTGCIDLANMSNQQLLMHQDVFERQTTMMYRPPEMIDVYQRHLVDFKADIWMLGCILYTLAFFKHPFQDQAQLAIVNGKFTVPEDERFDEKFYSLIYWLLNPNPRERPSLVQLIEGLNNYASVERFSDRRPNISRPAVRSERDRDLTEEEIMQEMKRIREERQAKVGRPQQQDLFRAPQQVQADLFSAPPQQSANIWAVPQFTAPSNQPGNQGNQGNWANFQCRQTFEGIIKCKWNKIMNGKC